MLPQQELDYIVGAALAKWAADNGHRTALPPAWLGNLHEMVRVFHDRLVAANRFDRNVFEQDVGKLVYCLASELRLPKAATE